MRKNKNMINNFRNKNFRDIKKQGYFSLLFMLKKNDNKKIKQKSLTLKFKFR